MRDDEDNRERKARKREPGEKGRKRQSPRTGTREKFEVDAYLSLTIRTVTYSPLPERHSHSLPLTTFRYPLIGGRMVGR